MRGTCGGLGSIAFWAEGLARVVDRVRHVVIPRNRRKAGGIRRERTRGRKTGHVAREAGRGLSRWDPAGIWLRGSHQGTLTTECPDLAFYFKIALFAVYSLGAEQT